MIKWGIIGLGNIAGRFAESLTHFDDAILYAGATRNEERRKFYEETYHCKTYETYYELLDDEEVDVVYIAVPHGIHYEWIMESLKHHKHVLSEKPAVLTSKEMEEIKAYAQKENLFFMEAMKARFIPIIKQIHEIIDQGKIGEIVSIENHFTFDMPYNPNHYMFDKVQGGTLYDAGCYGIAFVQDFIKDEIENIEVQGVINYDVDVHQNTTITYKSGKKAYLESGIDDPANKRFGIITGTRGTIEIDPFYRPEEAIITVGDNTYTIEEKYLFDDFHGEIEGVHNALKNQLTETKEMPIQDSIDYIKIMEDIKKKLQ